MHLLSQSQLQASILAMLVLEVYHLKWIWLSEWSCRTCTQRNLDCTCARRWAKYF